MSFEEIWQEHKTFILSLLGGVIVFFIGYLLITGPYEKQIKKDKGRVSSLARKARRQRVASGQTQEIKSKLEALRTEKDKLEGELGYTPREGFTLRAISTAPDIHFNEVVQRMQTEIVEPALSLDIRIAFDLGLGDTTPRTNTEREWYLNGLDIVNRIAVAGVAARVRSIEPIKIGRPPSRKRRQRRGATARYVRELPVTFTALGDPLAIDDLIRGLMPPGSRLGVVKASITSLDQLQGGDRRKRRRVRFGSEQLVQLDMTVKALLLDTEGSEEWPERRL